MRTVLHGLPWALPTFLAIILLVAFLYRRPQIFGDLPRVVVAIWILALGLIVSATLTPGSDAPYETAQPCVVEPPSVLSLHELFTPSEASLNVVLFVPLGVAAAFVPRLTAALVSLVIAAGLPFLIELTQRVLPVLGRGCQSADVIDNLTGLAIGALLGITVRLLIAIGRRPRRPRC